MVGGVPYGAWGLAVKCAERVSASAKPPSSEAEIADLRAKLDRMRQALVSVRDAVTHEVNTHSIACTVWMPAGNETMVDFIDQALSLAGEEKTGASDV
ncbi:hypothetical protein AE618_25975 [Bosea vaviloviae]|uniref:Uncharacterized protein n=2 Tax=Bosea vaviloviae TaxID=1526658 RepID=A0A0N1EYR1_9HYPH|nr:hypothetical protein AE618_25975 [Bosea vaviloviae]